MSDNYVSAGPHVEVRHESGVWWATCPECPGFSAAADSWAELSRLVAEFHEGPDAKHRGWIMLHYDMPVGAEDEPR